MFMIHLLEFQVMVLCKPSILKIPGTKSAFMFVKCEGAYIFILLFTNSALCLNQ